MIFNILDYGALGDGVSNDTVAIQKAIDTCAESGGGQVVVPGGRVYRSGSIVLKSYVELHLEMGAVLKASDCLNDFNLYGQEMVSSSEDSKPSYANSDYTGSPILYFIYAKDCEYVSITGHGKIDGNEQIFYGKITKWHIDGAFYPRMPLVYLENVSRLSIQNITLTNSAFWTVHMVGCDDVLIQGIRILNNLRMASSDGIDPDHCKNVRITNCHIESADDCIVLKNTSGAMQYGNCENIIISGCTLKSTSAAIKIGTESEAVFRNIVVSNCIISKTNRGISLQLRDKGSIENVSFSDINIETRRFSGEHWWGSSEPIAITALARNEKTQLGNIKNISFRNITCSGENGILLYGADKGNIRDIDFEHISIFLKKETDWKGDYYDLRPSYQKQIVEDTAHIIYAHNVKNVTFNCLRTDVGYGQLIHTDECEDITVNNIAI